MVAEATMRDPSNAEECKIKRLDPNFFNFLPAFYYTETNLNEQAPVILAVETIKKTNLRGGMLNRQIFPPL